MQRLPGMLRVDGEMRGAVELQIPAGLAELLPARERLPSLDVERNDRHRTNLPLRYTPQPYSRCSGSDDNAVRSADEGGRAMRQIPIGAKGSFSLLVQPEHLASRFKDAMLPPVFATPVMIMVMENAALNAIRAHLEPGESAVGTSVDVRHLAATPVGRLVTGEAEVTRVDGRRIEFTVRSTEGGKEIGAGTHSRAIIDLEKFLQRLG